MASFPEQAQGTRYLTEGGQETEVMYRHGFELPEFALFTLLDDPDGLAALQRMYAQYLDVAASHGFVPLMGGLEYRLSPDWLAALGIPAGALRDWQLRCTGFLRDAAAPYADRIGSVLVTGIVGPRGDAYTAPGSMTPEQAAEYHAPQMAAMREAGVDLVQAMTFGSVDEAVGVSWAAHDAGLPVSVSFMLDGGLVPCGVTLRDAIETTDARAGDRRPDFYGINCSHPYEFLPSLDDDAWMQRVRIVRPNASSKEKVELCRIGHLEEGDPVELGSLLGGLGHRYPHIDMWGGCCGTWDRHLAETAEAVSSV